MPARRSSVAFTVSVSVVLVLGALVIALVLLLTGAPTAIVVGAVLAAIPVGPLVAIFMWLDRYEPEPRSLLLLALGWGAFAATSLALVLQLGTAVVLPDADAVSSALVAPVTEEATKGLFIVLLLWFRRHELDGVLDGLVYAGMVGIGFAFVENILYLSSAYAGDESQAGGLGGAIVLFVVRCVLSPFAHPFFTAFIGIGIGLAVSTRRPLVRLAAPLAGYLLAVGSHAAWNGSLVLDGGRNAVATYVFLMVPAFLLLSVFAVWARSRERRLLTRALEDCARRGFVRPAEIPWLSSIGARRTARAHAERVGGGPAKEAMAAFQREGVELAFLHDRYLRGTAPAGFERLGQAHVDELRALRPQLAWPQPAVPAGSGPGAARG